MVVKLDLKDRRILLELDFAARNTDTEIAKAVGLSKEATAYRIKRLLSAGVITDFHTILDTTQLGLGMFRIFFRLQGATPAKERELIRHLIDHKQVMWFVSAYGNWQYNALVSARNAKEFMAFWHEFYERFGAIIEDKWITQVTRLVHFRRDYLLQGAERAAPLEWGKYGSPDIDEVDRKILYLISKDARASLTDIGSKMNLSYKTIGNRISELERKKVILGYRASLNLESIGYRYYKIHFQLQRLNTEKLGLFSAFLAQNPSSFAFTEAVGGPDFELDVESESEDTVLDIIREAKTRFPELIRSYEILRYLKEYKVDYLPFG
jgi:DNA-binding Lrp family transcriptional regulator